MNRGELDSHMKDSDIEEVEDIEASNVHHLVNIAATFSGAILRKAEFENNFDKVYSRVIEKMAQFEYINPEGESILEVFGAVGG